MSGRGPLKLKGGAPLKADSGVKKKKKPASEEQQQLVRSDSGNAAAAGGEASTGQDIKAITRGYELKPASETEDRRTEAEKRFELRQIQLEQERLKKLAAKSHRDRVADFNTMLANLSEHHDIPRVGPG